MSYREEFPDFDFEVPALVAGDPDAWEDTSWKNDQCPSFTCDVFVLFVDYADPLKREFSSASQFSMHCEDELMLATDNWEDVRAFIEDGKRDFPDYTPAPWLLGERVEYANGLQATVAHVDGDLAVLKVDGGYTVAEGHRDEFSFPREGVADERVPTLEKAVAQLVGARQALEV